MSITLASAKILKALPDCPKEPDRNKAYRELINKRALQMYDFRMAVVEKLRQNNGDSLIWFNDTFSMTQNILFRKSMQESSDCPMISFPKQEAFMRFVHEKVMSQENWGSRKSRGFGLTWTVVSIWDYLWLVFPDIKLLVASDKEEKVDGNNSDAIMPKMDYHIKNLPQWLKDELIPKYEPRRGSKFRKHRVMINPLISSTINGETTSGDMAVGGRKDAGFMDEAAIPDELESIVRSVFVVTKSMGYFSTDRGLARYFAKMWREPSFDWFNNKDGARWQDNPHWCGYTLWPDGTKGRLMKDAGDREGGIYYPGEIYHCEPGCPIKHHKDGGWDHSDAYDEACVRANFNSKQIAEELDMDPSTAGGSVFDVERVNRVIEMLHAKIADNSLTFDNISLDFVVPPQVPKFTTEEEFYNERGKWNVKVSNFKSGPIRIWKWPFSCRNPECKCKGTGKHVYSIGSDTSSGYATSDGAGSVVLDATAGEVVADLYGQFHAVALAIENIKLAKLYGTASGDDINAYLAIEANGEGATVNRICDQHGMLLHLSKLSPDARKKGKSRRLGVVVNTNKNDLLAHNIEKVINGGQGLWPLLVCPFPEYWYQMLTFIECAPNTKDQKAEKTKKAAQKGAKDDRVMMLNHAVHGAIDYYGNWRGILRPDEYRLKPVNFSLDTSLNMMNIA